MSLVGIMFTLAVQPESISQLGISRQPGSQLIEKDKKIGLKTPGGSEQYNIQVCIIEQSMIHFCWSETWSFYSCALGTEIPSFRSR